MHVSQYFAAHLEQIFDQRPIAKLLHLHVCTSFRKVSILNARTDPSDTCSLQESWGTCSRRSWSGSCYDTSARAASRPICCSDCSRSSISSACSASTASPSVRLSVCACRFLHGKVAFFLRTRPHRGLKNRLCQRGAKICCNSPLDSLQLCRVICVVSSTQSTVYPGSAHLHTKSFSFMQLPSGCKNGPTHTQCALIRVLLQQSICNWSSSFRFAHKLFTFQHLKTARGLQLTLCDSKPDIWVLLDKNIISAWLHARY